MKKISLFHLPAVKASCSIVPLLLIACFLITYHISHITSVSAQPPECKTPKAEIMPTCVVCSDVLFCYGNSTEYRVCENEPGLPWMCAQDCPENEPNCGNWYCTADKFPSGTILYNGVTFSVPSGGVYVCDSNVYGCASRECTGGEEPGPGRQLPDCGKGPIGNSIDLLEYFFPSGEPGNNISSGEVFKTVANGGDGFIIYKSTDTSYYERFRFNGNYIYHLEDTTWATEAGNVRCADTGREAYFTLVDGKYDDPCRAYQEIKAGVVQEGMKWVQRFTKVCEEVSYPGTVIGVDKNTHQCCQAPYTGAMNHGMRLDYQGCIVFPTGVVSEDAVMLTITGGAGAGEHFYYDHSRGWVGFDRGNPGTGNFITDTISTTPPGENCLFLENFGITRLDVNPGLVCADVNYQAQKTIETILTPTPTPGGNEGEVTTLGFFDLSGRVSLKKLKFPDYSLFEQVVRKALPALLPKYWQDPNNPGSLNIPEGTLPIKIKHRIEGQSEQDRVDPNQTVTNSRTDPAFVPLLAESHVLSALSGGKPAESINYVLPELEADIPAEGASCVEGGKTLDEDLTAISNPNPAFSAQGILEKVEEIVGNILRRFFRVEVAIESRGNVYGQKALDQKTEAIGASVPGHFLEDEGASSQQEGVYEVAASVFSDDVEGEFKYESQKAVFERYCDLLCSVYPAAFKPKDCECE